MDSTGARPYRVLQISDSHLFASRDGKLLGLNTEASLALVLEKIGREQLGADLLLATGDISQDGSAASYRRFLSHINKLGIPSLWMQGNHDLTAPMQLAMGDLHALSPCSYRLGAWQIIMLNSAIEYQVSGEFAAEQLVFLDHMLMQHADHTLVCLHHHPVKLGSRWLDSQIVSNADAFWRCMASYDQVRGVIFGHVHQEFSGHHGSVPLWSVPSTCVQFAPRSHDFTVDTQAPGYRWLDLHPDGHITTGVERVENMIFEVDLSIRGY